MIIYMSQSHEIKRKKHSTQRKFVPNMKTQYSYIVIDSKVLEEKETQRLMEWNRKFRTHRNV